MGYIHAWSQKTLELWFCCWVEIKATDYGSTGSELSWRKSFCFAPVILWCMTGSLMMLALGLKCNLLFLLLCQYGALRYSIVFNKWKRKNLFLYQALYNLKQKISHAHSSIPQSTLKFLNYSGLLIYSHDENQSCRKIYGF